MIFNIRHASALLIPCLINRAYSLRVSGIGSAPALFFRLLKLSVIATPKTLVLRRWLENALKLRAGLTGCRDRDEYREPHAGPAPFAVTDEYLEDLRIGLGTI